MSDDGEFDSFSNTSSDEAREEAISSPAKRSMFGPIDPVPVTKRQTRVVDITNIKERNERILRRKWFRCLAAHRLKNKNALLALRKHYTLIASHKVSHAAEPPPPTTEPAQPESTQETRPEPTRSEPAVTPREPPATSDTPRESAAAPKVQERPSTASPRSPPESTPTTPEQPVHASPRPASAAPAKAKTSPTSSPPSKPSTPSAPSPEQRPQSPGSSSSSTSSSSCAPVRRPATGFAELLINPRAKEQDRALHEDDAPVRVVYSVPSKRSSHVQQGAPVLSIRRRKRPAWEDLTPSVKMPVYDASKDPHCRQLFQRPQQQRLLAQVEKGSKDVAQQRKLSAGAKLAWRFVVNNTYGKKKGDGKSVSPPPPMPCMKAVVGMRVSVPSGKRLRNCCVVGVRANDVKVHYEGHADAYDEWIPYDSKRFKDMTVVGLGQRVVHPSHIPPGALVENLHQPIQDRPSVDTTSPQGVSGGLRSESPSVQCSATPTTMKDAVHEARRKSKDDDVSLSDSGSEGVSRSSGSHLGPVDVQEEEEEERNGTYERAEEVKEAEEEDEEKGDNVGHEEHAEPADRDSDYSDSYEDDFV